VTIKCFTVLCLNVKKKLIGIKLKLNLSILFTCWYKREKILDLPGDSTVGKSSLLRSFTDGKMKSIGNFILYPCFQCCKASSGKLNLYED
jgi:hypothetical protein